MNRTDGIMKETGPYGSVGFNHRGYPGRIAFLEREIVAAVKGSIVVIYILDLFPALDRKSVV